MGRDINLLGYYLRLLRLWSSIESIRVCWTKWSIISWNLFAVSVSVCDWCKRIFMVCQKVWNTTLVQLPDFLHEGKSPELNSSSEEDTAHWFRSQTQAIQSQHPVCFAISRLAFGNALRVSNLLASLGLTGRRVVLGHTLNTLRHVITKKIS